MEENKITNIVINSVPMTIRTGDTLIIHIPPHKGRTKAMEEFLVALRSDLQKHKTNILMMPDDIENVKFTVINYE